MSSSTPRRPTGYRLVLPPDWWHVPLGASRHASVAALIRHQVHRSPKEAAPLLRGGLRRELTTIVERASLAGASDLYLSVGTEQGIPLAASLLVHRMPLPRTGTDDPLVALEILARSAAGGASVLRFPVVRGEALAVRRSTPMTVPDSALDALGKSLGHEARRAAAAYQPFTTHFDVFVPVPCSAEVLLLAFSTPLPPLAEAFVDLFEAMACSLSWTYAPTTTRPRQRARPVAPRVLPSRLEPTVRRGVNERTAG